MSWEPFSETGIVFDIIGLSGRTPCVNERLISLMSGSLITLRIVWRIWVGMLLGPVALLFSMLQIIASTSISSARIKTKEFSKGDCRKSLKDLLPSYFLSSRIVLAIVEKYELKFSTISLETVIILSFFTRQLWIEQYFDLILMISFMPWHTFLRLILLSWKKLI